MKTKLLTGKKTQMEAGAIRQGCTSTSWATLPEFQGYEIGNSGDIYSTKREKALRQYDKNGYKYVFLYDGHSKRKCMFVHRLVAIAFLENPDNLPQINHKDEDTSNNCVSNLEWCSAEYNCNYGHHNENLKRAFKKNGGSMKGRHHTKEAIRKMRDAKLGKPSKRRRRVKIGDVIYDSATDAMKRLSICTRRFYKLIEEDGNGYV
jgi:hypothetical protein